MKPLRTNSHPGLVYADTPFVLVVLSRIPPELHDKRKAKYWVKGDPQDGTGIDLAYTGQGVAWKAEQEAVGHRFSVIFTDEKEHEEPQ